MCGIIRWYHPELRMALVELDHGYAVGAVEEGDCAIGDRLHGTFRHDEVEQLVNDRTGDDVIMHVEAGRISEDQANDLLGLMRH